MFFLKRGFLWLLGMIVVPHLQGTEFKKDTTHGPNIWWPGLRNHHVSVSFFGTRSFGVWGWVRLWIFSELGKYCLKTAKRKSSGLQLASYLFAKKQPTLGVGDKLDQKKMADVAAMNVAWRLMVIVDCSAINWEISICSFRFGMASKLMPHWSKWYDDVAKWPQIHHLNSCFMLNASWCNENWHFAEPKPFFKHQSWNQGPFIAASASNFPSIGIPA